MMSLVPPLSKSRTAPFGACALLLVLLVACAEAAPPPTPTPAVWTTYEHNRDHGVAGCRDQRISLSRHRPAGPQTTVHASKFGFHHPTALGRP